MMIIQLNCFKSVGTGAIAGHDPLDSTTVTDTFEPFELDEEISLDGLHIGIPKVI